MAPQVRRACARKKIAKKNGENVIADRNNKKRAQWLSKETRKIAFKKRKERVKNALGRTGVNNELRVYLPSARGNSPPRNETFFS